MFYRRIYLTKPYNNSVIVGHIHLYGIIVGHIHLYGIIMFYSKILHTYVCVDYTE